MKSISGKNIQTSLCSLDHSIFHSLHLPNLSVQSPQVLRRHLVLLQASSGSTRVTHRSKLLALSKILHSVAALIQSKMVLG